MTTKKNTEITDNKCNGKSACPFKDNAQQNYYYDYHYTYEKTEKEPMFEITSRGRKVIDAIAVWLIAIIGGVGVFSIISSACAIRRIENTLDKKPVPVHTAPSINHHTK